MAFNQTDHGDISWWTASEGWPETTEDAFQKYVFANKSKIIPYGSYVFGRAGYGDLPTDVLRVESDELLKRLNENYSIVKRVILGERF